jgi:membrane fusion protein (multidrug efflux system)
VISSRLKEPGDVVPVNSHILTLIDPSVLSIELHVSELLLADLGIGDSVQIQIDALGNRLLPGRITRIHPVIDHDTRQGLIEVALQPIPEGARPGQLARITFRIDKTTGLTIPFASLHYDNQGSFVYRIDAQNAARRVSVNTGLQLGDRIEILSGLHENEQVVLSGLLNMTEGRKVRVVEPQPNG